MQVLVALMKFSFIVKAGWKVESLIFQRKELDNITSGKGTLTDFYVFPVGHFELCWVLVIKMQDVKTLIRGGGAARCRGGLPRCSLT